MDNEKDVIKNDAKGKEIEDKENVSNEADRKIQDNGLNRVHRRQKMEMELLIHGRQLMECLLNRGLSDNEYVNKLVVQHRELLEQHVKLRDNSHTKQPAGRLPRSSGKLPGPDRHS